MRLGLDHVHRRLQRLGTRRAAGRLEVASREPSAEAFDADRPGLTVAVDVEVGIAGPIRGRGTAPRFCASSIRTSACVRRRPTLSPFSSSMASSSAVTRQPRVFNCARSASNAARSSFFIATSRSSTSGANGAPGSLAAFSNNPSSGSRMSLAASVAAAMRVSDLSAWSPRWFSTMSSIGIGALTSTFLGAQNPGVGFDGLITDKRYSKGHVDRSSSASSTQHAIIWGTTSPLRTGKAL